MATILSDKELSKLIGSVILNGDLTFIRPNSYILRLGQKGEFLYGEIHDSLDGFVH